jgi:hypothetical protein
MADSEWRMADGKWQMADGYWLLAIRHPLFAIHYSLIKQRACANAIARLPYAAEATEVWLVFGGGEVGGVQLARRAIDERRQLFRQFAFDGQCEVSRS